MKLYESKAAMEMTSFVFTPMIVTSFLLKSGTRFNYLNI